MPLIANGLYSLRVQIYFQLESLIGVMSYNFINNLVFFLGLLDSTELTAVSVSTHDMVLQIKFVVVDWNAVLLNMSYD